MRPAVRFAVIAICFLLSFRALSANENSAATQSRPRPDVQKPRDAEREEIFHEIMTSGAVQIYGRAVSHSTTFLGLGLVAGKASLGRDTAYDVVLWDSPSLQKNLELLSRLPELATLSIYTNRKDDVLPLIRKIHVTVVTIQDFSELHNHDGTVSGIVVDRQGKPVHGGSVTISTPSGRHLCGVGLNGAGEFAVGGLPSVPYRLCACGTPASPSWFGGWLGGGLVARQSDPVNANPGDRNVRIVLDVADASTKSNR